MIPTYIQDRTIQFYEWEQRGRGWYLAQEPIDLEPSFEPFFIRTRPAAIIDDGKRPTFLNSLTKFLLPTQTEKLPSHTLSRYKPFPFANDDDLTHLRVYLPQSYTANSTMMEQLLLMLSYCIFPISFELIASHELISIQVVCREQVSDYISNQIKSFVPGCIIEDISFDDEHIIEEHDYTLCVDLGLQEEFMRPLASKQSMESYTSLFAELEHIQETEHAALQILFCGTINQWSASIVDAVTVNNGDSFFYDAPEMPGLAKEKVSSALFAVTIRLVVQAPTRQHAERLLQRILIPIIHSSKSPFNSLMPLGGEPYDFETRIDDILQRQSHRSGMLLNVKELANLLHFPSVHLSKKLQVIVEKTKAAPSIVMGNGYVLGRNIHQGVDTEVSLHTTQRLQHLHIIGATGTGKSTLLQNLIVQDINAGNGVAVLDAHGDLIESIMKHIPQERIRDVIVVDPSDSEFPIGFNILSAHSDIEKEILSSDLVAIFRRLSTSWGDQMNSVFANAILAFLESTKGGTLADLRRFLVEKSFREAFLATVTDEHIVYYWQKEYPLLRGNSIGSILTRLDSFLRPKVIRNMVSQQKSLDFEMILTTKKIVLVKLSHGLIGAENSYLLGSVIVSKLQQAAMARQATAKEFRTPFYTYIDEFQNFITNSMSLILSGARKYGLGLILAHQSMQQLQKEDSELASSVLANAGTRICFRLGEQDARTFNASFASFAAEDLQRLNTGHAIARVERNDYDFTLQTSILEADKIPDSYVQQIIDFSRATYATPKEHIEPTIIQEESEHEEQKEEKKQHKSYTKPSTKAPENKTEETVKNEEVKPKDITEEQKVNTVETFKKQKQQSLHRTLQTTIKKIAEQHGYKATIEKSILNGAGKVDVSLEKDGKRIAWEISVTSDVEWELHNIEKCITAGYDMIIVCAEERKVQEQLLERITAMDMTIKNKVHITSPEHIYSFFKPDEPRKGTPETIKGYRVKVNYSDLSKDNIQATQESISKVITSALNKKKE